MKFENWKSQSLSLSLVLIFAVSLSLSVRGDDDDGHLSPPPTTGAPPPPPGSVVPAPPPWIRLDGEINFDITGRQSRNFETELNVRETKVYFELLIREGIRLALKGRLERVYNSQTNEALRFNFGQFIEEAFIEIQIDERSGLPRAILTLGKHQMAFGQSIKALPVFKKPLLYELSEVDEVIGMTVELPMHFFKIVDSVAVSVFEAEAGDLHISQSHGTSMKLTKAISRQLEAEISALMIRNEGSPRREQRASLGLVYTSRDGDWKVWSEGIISRYNPDFAGVSRTGASLGTAYKLGPGAIAIEASYIEKEAHELVIAYNLPVGRYLILSPEIRRRESRNGEDDDTIIALRARLKFHREFQNTLLTGRRRPLATQ